MISQLSYLYHGFVIPKSIYWNGDQAYIWWNVNCIWTSVAVVDHHDEMHCKFKPLHIWWCTLLQQTMPLPWASVHWLVQCTLECHWLTPCTLGYHWATQRIHAGYTGTPLEKLSWNSPTLECHWRNLVESSPRWDATGETLTFAAFTGTPLEGLWQPTHGPTHTVKHAE